MPLVVYYWANLQSVRRLRCCGNITRTRNVSEYMLVLVLFLVFFVDAWGLWPWSEAWVHTSLKPLGSCTTAKVTSLLRVCIRVARIALR